MKYILEYQKRAYIEDLPALSHEIRLRIKNDIDKKLLTYPEKYGKPLRKSLKGAYKLRVGNYRVLFRIEGNIVKIFAIKHRSVVYNEI